MSRFFIGSIFFVFYGNVFHISNCNSEIEKDYIVWHSNKKLEWKDFEKNEFAGVGVSARSAIRIKLDYEIIQSVKWFKVECLFLKKESTSRFDQTDYLLKHEQGHFDIGEIFARQLRKRLLEIRTNINRTNYLQLDSIYHIYSQGMIEMQLIYDNETSHSTEKAQQKAWDIKIQNQLDSLSNFSKYKY